MTHAWHPAALLVDGEQRPAADGWTYPTRNPATGEVLGQVPDAGVADADAAVDAAHRAFRDTVWSADAHLRRAAMERLQRTLVEHAGSLAALMTAETGLPVALAGPHLHEPLARLLGPHEPVTPGVVAVITPATSPLAHAIDAIGRALASGSTVVLKPAADAAWTALELGRIAATVLPRGVLEVVSSRDVDVAIALTTDPRVDAVDFAGSAVAGERVRVTATGAGKRVRLDVGGTVPVHVTDDAGLPAAVAAAARAMCVHAGQGCRLPQTVVVPAARYDEAVEVAVRTMEETGVGDPTDPHTLCGPVLSPVQRDRVLRYLALAESEGGRFATGGRALDRSGWWVAPTVVTGLGAQSRVAREEVLGPVLVVVRA